MLQTGELAPVWFYSLTALALRGSITWSCHDNYKITWCVCASASQEWMCNSLLVCISYATQTLKGRNNAGHTGTLWCTKQHLLTDHMIKKINSEDTTTVMDHKHQFYGSMNQHKVSAWLSTFNPISNQMYSICLVATVATSAFVRWQKYYQYFGANTQPWKVFSSFYKTV